MATITIPKNQHVLAREFVLVIITKQGRSVNVYLKSTLLTYTASYDEVFDSADFDVRIHGFLGINTELANLCFIIDEI